jgi:putative nucleotidyltransferase with HDIG domain
MNLEELARKVEDLKTLPAAFYQVNSLMESPSCTAGDIAEVISMDQALSAKLLRIVNSALYALPTRINSIVKSVNIIGFAGIRELIVSTSVTDIFIDNPEGSTFDRQEFWKHSLGTGITARILGKYLKKLEPEELFVAGLLHDIGKMIIDQYATTKFVEIMNLAARFRISMREAENGVLGFDHCRVGEMIARKWELSPTLIEAISHHHWPLSAEGFPRPTAVIYLANIIVQALELGSSGNHWVPLIDGRIWEIMELPVSVLEPVVAETLRNFSDLEKVFLMGK